MRWILSIRHCVILLWQHVSGGAETLSTWVEAKSAKHSDINVSQEFSGWNLKPTWEEKLPIAICPPLNFDIFHISTKTWPSFWHRSYSRWWTSPHWERFHEPRHGNMLADTFLELPKINSQAALTTPSMSFMIKQQGWEKLFNGSFQGTSNL